MRKLIAILVLLLIAAAAGAREEDIEDFAELDLEELLDVVYSAAKHTRGLRGSGAFGGRRFALYTYPR